jgi:hypothetical protein
LFLILAQEKLARGESRAPRRITSAWSGLAISGLLW